MKNYKCWNCKEEKVSYQHEEAVHYTLCKKCYSTHNNKEVYRKIEPLMTTDEILSKYHLLLNKCHMARSRQIEAKADAKRLTFLSVQWVQKR